MKTITKILTEITEKAFISAGYEEKFAQVFRTARKAGLAPDSTELTHLYTLGIETIDRM